MNTANNTPAVIFLDVDGTIVDVNGNIPASAKEAISRAQTKGNICVVNTGRPFSHIVDSVLALGVKGYICSCGQYIAVNGEVIQNEVFPPELSQRIIAEAKACRVDLFIESEAGLFHSFVHPISGRMNQEFDRFRKRGFDVDADVETKDFFFSKFCAWEYTDSDMKRFLDFLKPYMYVIRKSGAMYEMVKNGCSKAEGIMRFLAACGLRDCETYAIGDSGNDREMLSAAKHGIAMGNAPESLKGISEYVTDTLENDGLYKAFEHYKLI